MANSFLNYFPPYCHQVAIHNIKMVHGEECWCILESTREDIVVVLVISFGGVADSSIGGGTGIFVSFVTCSLLGRFTWL